MRLILAEPPKQLSVNYLRVGAAVDKRLSLVLDDAWFGRLAYVTLAAPRPVHVRTHGTRPAIDQRDEPTAVNAMHARERRIRPHFRSACLATARRKVKTSEL